MYNSHFPLLLEPCLGTTFLAQPSGRLGSSYMGPQDTVEGVEETLGVEGEEEVVVGGGGAGTALEEPAVGPDMGGMGPMYPGGGPPAPAGPYPGWPMEEAGPYE